MSVSCPHTASYPALSMEIQGSIIRALNLIYFINKQRKKSFKNMQYVTYAASHDQFRHTSRKPSSRGTTGSRCDVMVSFPPGANNRNFAVKFSACNGVPS